jgi:hypothetical protein
MFVGVPNVSICAVAQRRGNPSILIGHPSQVPGTTSIFPDYAAAARLALGAGSSHPVLTFAGAAPHLGGAP